MKKLSDKTKHLKNELNEYYRDYQDWCLNWYETDYEGSIEYYGEMWYHEYLDDEVGIRNRKLNSILDIENEGPIIYNSRGIVFHPDYGYAWDY